MLKIFCNKLRPHTSIRNAHVIAFHFSRLQLCMFRCWIYIYIYIYIYIKHFGKTFVMWSKTLQSKTVFIIVKHGTYQQPSNSVSIATSLRNGITRYKLWIPSRCTRLFSCLQRTEEFGGPRKPLGLRRSYLRCKAAAACNLLFRLIYCRL